MTDDQINIAIAELLGFTDIKPSRAFAWEFYGTSPDPEIGRTKIANYANDLNAIQSALPLLHTDELSRQFMFNLYTVLDEKYEAFEYATGEPVITAFYLLQAKPREWAEAFLRTFGKWID